MPLDGEGFGLQNATVRVVEQLSVFLANKPETVADVCDALAEERVNIYGLTITDTSNHAVVRMVVSDTRRAMAVFEAHGGLTPILFT